MSTINATVSAQTDTNEARKTITIGASTWRRIKKYGTYGDSFDTILQRILTEYEHQETGIKKEGLF